MGDALLVEGRGLRQLLGGGEVIARALELVAEVGAAADVVGHHGVVVLAAAGMVAVALAGAGLGVGDLRQEDDGGGGGEEDDLRRGHNSCSVRRPSPYWGGRRRTV